VGILDRAYTLGRGLLDLLYPTFCAGCGQTGILYCPTCRGKVCFITPPLCPLCGRPCPLGSTLRAPTPCERCVAHPVSLDGIRSVALFEGTLRKVIHRFKYDYVQELAIPLGEMLVDYCRPDRGRPNYGRLSRNGSSHGQGQEPLPFGDVIIPVPLHNRRLRERGYNQSALLAKRLGTALQVPVLHNVLCRNRYTMSQTRLDAQARSRNVAGAFSCSGTSVHNKRVLLIDDVCTTGATLNACGLALREGGAQSVWALTVARALPAALPIGSR
jgi:ComF family protein